MAGPDIIRRLHGAFRNAAVWGAAWFTLAAVVTIGLRLGDGIHPGIALGDALVTGIRVGIMGGVAGTAFAAFISLFYRGRRLSEISWVRFGLGGGMLTGVFVPTFLILGNLLSGDGFPVLAHVLDDGLYAAVFGGISAGGSMWLAQRAGALSSAAQEQLDGEHALDSLGEGESAQEPLTQRSRLATASD